MRVSSVRRRTNQVGYNPGDFESTREDSMADETTKPGGSPPPKWVLKAMTRTHVFMNGITGGKLFNQLAGDEVVFITMTGAKSGRTITIPLMYVPHNGGILLVASQGGAPKNPVWYNNLVKHPDLKARHRGIEMKLRARLATAEEKPALGPI